MKRYWTIYCHTLISDGRRYIGLTQYTMMHRWNQHCAQSKHAKGNKSHFINAIRLYGKDAFTHEVLAQSWDLEGANLTEEQLIEQECTRNSEFGFNLARGGSHTLHPVKNPWDRPGFRVKGLASLAKANASLTLQQRSQRAKKLWSDPDFASRVIGSSKKTWSDPELKIRQSELQKIIKARPEVKERHKLNSKMMWESESYRLKNKTIWKDPEFRERCQSGLVHGSLLNKSKTHCPAGHKYSLENTYVRKSGSRACINCKREQQRESIRAIRARRKQLISIPNDPC